VHPAQACDWGVREQCAQWASIRGEGVSEEHLRVAHPLEGMGLERAARDLRCKLAERALLKVQTSRESAT